MISVHDEAADVDMVQSSGVFNEVKISVLV